jgi:hypothetical protein
MLRLANDMTADAQHFGADQCFALANTVDLHFLAYIELIDRTGTWQADCVPSLEHWVSMRYGMSLATAREYVVTARAITALPAIAKAYSDGLLSKEKLVALCSFVEPDDDERWALESQWYSVSRIRRCARFARRMDRNETAAKDRRRFFSMTWDRDKEVLHLEGELPGADAVLFWNAMHGCTGDPVQGLDGSWTSIDERQADALLELAATKLGEQTDKARVTVVVHVEARELEAVDGTAELEHGALVSSEVARRLVCDGYVQTIHRSRGRERHRHRTPLSCRAEVARASGAGT